jgi:hypothetical protein
MEVQNEHTLNCTVRVIQLKHLCNNLRAIHVRHCLTVRASN